MSKTQTARWVIGILILIVVALGLIGGDVFLIFPLAVILFVGVFGYWMLGKKAEPR